ncbi:MAG: glycosyltransferase, partial [Gemmatimonadota bacterium]
APGCRAAPPGSRASRRCPNAHLLLVGDGPERFVIESLIDGLGLDNRVHLLGLRSDVADLLAGSDLFLLSSVSEAASLSILEAMAVGLPVVATRVGGNPEVVVEGETGHLVPPGDLEAFADRVVELLRRPDLRRRMGEAGRRRVRTEFHLDRVADRYLRLYGELVGEMSVASDRTRARDV